MIKKPLIVVIDYEMGNIRSIVKKINRIGYEAIVSSEKDIINKADKLILPGVGHYRTGMENLNKKQLIDILSRKVIFDKAPILGICLGMQLFTNHSEEGDTKGLGWIKAETVKFDLNNIRHKVPHMGWNTVEKKKTSRLFENISLENPYYFVHSYHVNCNDPSDILSTTLYGYEFVSSVEKGNIFGTQFHPEKSHGWGEQLLSNFLNL